MKFGIQYQLNVPRPLDREDWDPDDENRIMKEALEQIEFADKLGFDYMFETEHHFLEEYSASSAPEVFMAAASQRTKKMRLVHGIVQMPPRQNHPARVAERIATLDLVSDGRVEFGTGEGATVTEIEGFGTRREDKKEAWEESTRDCLRMMTSVPYPGYEGIHFSMPERNIVPKPLQKPHPPIFQPFASSENTIRWCAREGVTAILPPMHLALQNRLYEVYAEEAAAHGRTLAPGEGLGVLRDVIVADTDEEAMEAWAHGAAFCGAAWFAPFHFGEPLRDPATGVAPSPQEMVERGMLLVGSVDTVTRSFERLLADTPVRWLFAWTYNGLVPHPMILRSLDLFQTKVLPRVSD